MLAVDYVEQSTYGKTAINPQEYPDRAKSIFAYADGARIKVTYYHTEDACSENRSIQVDPSLSRHSIHVQYTRIDDMEMILPDGSLPTTWDPEIGAHNSEGRAIIYPGVPVSINDVFHYSMGDGNIGEYYVTEITPLTHRSSRAHEIKMHLTRYVGQDRVELLRASTIREARFDRSVFFTGDASAVLEYSEYRVLETIRHHRGRLIGHYYRSFMNTALESFVRPDGIYDPYVTEFVSRITSFEDHPTRPRQLLRGIVDRAYDYTLWAVMHDRHRLDLDGVLQHWQPVVHTPAPLSLTMSELTNRQYLQVLPPPLPDDITPDILPGYVCSPAFYAGDVLGMTALEQYTYEAIRARRLTDGAAFVLNHMKTAHLLPLDSGFYQIPIILWIAMVVEYQLSRAPSGSTLL